MTNVAGVVTAALAAACVVAMSSVADGAPVLRSAEVRITMTSPTACDVTMALIVSGATEIDHRLQTFDGSRAELISVRGARQAADLRAIGRTESLVLRPDQQPYGFQYRAVQPATGASRCPIWLPTVPADGQSRSVRLEVDLPRSASPSDSLPAFAWTGTHGTAVLANLPAFVRVVYGPEGAARPWSVNRTIDALAIALVAAASTVWIWRTRR